MPKRKKKVDPDHWTRPHSIPNRVEPPPDTTIARPQDRFNFTTDFPYGYKSNFPSDTLAIAYFMALGDNRIHFTDVRAVIRSTWVALSRQFKWSYRVLIGKKMENKKIIKGYESHPCNGLDPKWTRKENNKI